MRKVSTILAALAAVLVPGVPAAASASTAQVHPAVVFYDLCLLADGASCTATNGTAFQVNVSTNVDRWVHFGFNIQDGACPEYGGQYGVVTPDCPFTPGAGLNVQMINSQIVTFNDGGNCLFATSTSADAVVMDPCEDSDPWDWWVVTPNTGESAYWLVNVGYSDEEYAEGAGYDQPFGAGTGCSGSGCRVWLDDVMYSGNDVSWNLDQVIIVKPAAHNHSPRCAARRIQRGLTGEFAACMTMTRRENT